VFSVIKLLKLQRRVLQRWKGNLALITAYAKLWPNLRRARKTLICPVRSLAERALNIECFKAMNSPSRVKRLSGNRDELRLLRLWM
jgi:hypothetical protein